MKYSIGDYVVILDGREKPAYRGVWTSAMTRYIGRIGKVVKIDPLMRDYAVDVDGGKCWYVEEWLAPAPTTEDILRKVDLAFGDLTKKAPKPKRLVRNGRAMVVFWDDGTKTIVKRAEGEADNDYAAFTAALAIKVFGTNSEVNRIVKRTEAAEKKKGKK